MNEYRAIYSSYPIKVTCRTASLAKLRKMRLSWFAAGVAFSIGCTSALTPIFTTTISVTSVDSDNDLIASLNAKNSPPLEEIISASPQETVSAEIAETATSTQQAEVSPESGEVAARPVEIISAASPPERQEEIYPKTIEIKTKKGDTIISLLADTGISLEEAQNSFDAIRAVFNPRKLGNGITAVAKIDKDGSGNIIMREFKIPASASATLELKRTEDNLFSVREIDAPVSKKLARVGGNIDGSIYKTGTDIGIPAGILNEMITAYSYDVDFQRDIKKGDSIDVLFERTETENGAVIGTGNFVFSELSLGNQSLKIYRYTDKNGNADFYNEKGESVRKALLRTPINGARITSGYGMREHPLSGYTKMHRGVDFGAAIGTPIYAAGDGIVEVAARNGGYGNYLRIKHNNKYSSAYAHLSRYAGGVSPGKRVKQGQIIAYTGNTGASTGPHLHYEILANNEQINPANIKFKTGNVLQGKELAAFKRNMDKIEAKLASVGRGKTVAMLDENGKPTIN